MLEACRRRVATSRAQFGSSDYKVFTGESDGDSTYTFPPAFFAGFDSWRLQPFALFFVVPMEVCCRTFGECPLEQVLFFP